MKKPFSLLRTAAVEAADMYGLVLDESLYVHSEGYEFDRYVWTLTQSSEFPGMNIEISVSGDDIDKFFREAP